MPKAAGKKAARTHALAKLSMRAAGRVYAGMGAAMQTMQAFDIGMGAAGWAATGGRCARPVGFLVERCL